MLRNPATMSLRAGVKWLRNCGWCRRECGLSISRPTCASVAPVNKAKTVADWRACKHNVQRAPLFEPGVERCALIDALPGLLYDASCLAARKGWPPIRRRTP